MPLPASRPLGSAVVLAGLGCLVTVLMGIAAPGLATPASAQAMPRSIGECERLKNDLAYNQCLAMFGPAARNVAGGDGSNAGETIPLTAAALPAAEDPSEATSRRRGRHRYARRGRQAAAFAVSDAEETGSRRRRR